MNAKIESRLHQILSKYEDRADTNQVQFALACPASNWEWTWENRTEKYFIASATKLYIVALIMQLRAAQILDIDRPVITYLPEKYLAGIHVLKGKDSGPLITTRHLLSQTSGIADYFEEKDRTGTNQFEKALEQDFFWDLEDVLRITREELQPKFYPGASGEAHYSDTNYQLLGALIEQLTGAPLETVIHERIASPLALKDTYLFTKKEVPEYASVSSMLNGKQPIHIPKAMASVRSDGGIVSSAGDGIRFLKAFTGGALFPKAYFLEMQAEWNPIFKPFDYGMGLMRFKLPRIYSPFDPIPPMIGHSGASGTVLFYVPEMDLYLSGTVNQIKKRSLSFRLMVNVVMRIKNELK